MVYNGTGDPYKILDLKNISDKETFSTSCYPGVYSGYNSSLIKAIK